MLAILCLGLIGCDIYKTADIHEASDLTVSIDITTTQTVDGDVENKVTAIFYADGVKQQVDDVKMNDTSLTWSESDREFSLTGIDLTQGEQLNFTVYLNQDNSFYAEVVDGSFIEINPTASIGVKRASSLSDLPSATVETNLVSVGDTDYLGIEIVGGDSFLSFESYVYVSDGSNQSQNFEISNDYYISPSILNGEVVGFTPTALTIQTDYYDEGTLNTSFKAGSIRRYVQLTNEYTITN